MITIILATNNKNKVREIKSVFNNDMILFKTLDEIGFNEEIDETGKSFVENAIIKAKYISKKYKAIALSDDSGLEVKALNNEPGIYSARYAGTHNDEDNNQLLLKNLQGIEERDARYVCAICVYYPDDTYLTTEEYCYGKIIDDRRGKNGFGYDPYFYVEEFGKTLAEVSLDDKNRISHRAKALRALKEKLNEDFSIK
ncbi:MAG: XTP/dITP diphosphatase [Anaeroplasma sp.]